MVNALEMYDWQFMTQILLVVSIFTFVIFFKRLKKYSELLVALPFSLSVGLSIFLSDNLVSYFFFSEILFVVSNIIYNNCYKLYNKRYFENVRYIFWIIIFFTYYNSFGSFAFNAVPRNTGIEFTFVVALLLSLIFLMILNFLLREKSSNSVAESIGYEVFTVSIFCMKTILIISDLTDAIPPKHHTIIDIMILLFIFVGSILSLQFHKSSNVQKLKSIIRALVILSLLPLLIIGESKLWENFSIFTLTIIAGFVFLELIVSYLDKSRIKLILVFLLICFISGLSPFGHIFILFKDLVDSDNQVILLLGVITSLLTISVISKRMFELSYDLEDHKSLK
ncbi:hypothetical protein [Halobacteriovorax sp.]|uniref:hypothetical protein n=1 Tax=Halobacteriovorax sp. TaxID=2020862 RepID=UPI003568AED5